MLAHPLLSWKAGRCLWIRSSPELLRVRADAAGSRGGIIHHPNSTETADDSGRARLCMTWCLVRRGGPDHYTLRRSR